MQEFTGRTHGLYFQIFKSIKKGKKRAKFAFFCPFSKTLTKNSLYCYHFSQMRQLQNFSFATATA